mmetsp:Transcript_10906/g.16658  ORF Transcript_10906/g.16658 Transcript_10906/m.16658 type:complete len:221 (+) Transcript_10906:1122-1784(+)
MAKWFRSSNVVPRSSFWGAFPITMRPSCSPGESSAEEDCFDFCGFLSSSTPSTWSIRPSKVPSNIKVTSKLWTSGIGISFNSLAMAAREMRVYGRMTRRKTCIRMVLNKSSTCCRINSSSIMRPSLRLNIASNLVISLFWNACTKFVMATISGSSRYGRASCESKGLMVEACNMLAMTKYLRHRKRLGSPASSYDLNAWKKDMPAEANSRDAMCIFPPNS